MIRKMPHKVRNDEPLPGQIVNKVPEHTLTDYLVNKGLITDRKKLTFDEWRQSIFGTAQWEFDDSDLEAAWEAGQENK